MLRGGPALSANQLHFEWEMNFPLESLLANYMDQLLPEQNISLSWRRNKPCPRKAWSVVSKCNCYFCRESRVNIEDQPPWKWTWSKILSTLCNIFFPCQERRWVCPSTCCSPSLSSCYCWPIRSQRRRWASPSSSTTSCSPWSWSRFLSSSAWSYSTCTTARPAPTRCPCGSARWGPDLYRRKSRMNEWMKLFDSIDIVAILWKLAKNIVVFSVDSSFHCELATFQSSLLEKESFLSFARGFSGGWGQFVSQRWGHSLHRQGFHFLSRRHQIEARRVMSKWCH